MHLLAASVLIAIVSVVNAFSRNDFPPHFMFGASTSAYQVLSLIYTHTQTNKHTKIRGINLDKRLYEKTPIVIKNNLVIIILFNRHFLMCENNKNNTYCKTEGTLILHNMNVTQLVE